MKTRKRELSSSSKFFNKEVEETLLRRMGREKANGYYRAGSFSSEIVWGNSSYVFPQIQKKKHSEFKKGMFLFGMVRRDAKNFLKSGKKHRMPKKNPSIYYNKDYRDGYDGAITATDLNHAYWRIAFNLGIISKNTYNRGLEVESKSTRLATLSTLGASKKYFMIIDGNVTKQMMVVGGNEELARLYTLIRYTCFKMMMEVRMLLGSDFLAYKTDCIYYKKSKESVAVVRDYFKEHGLLMKQLV